MHHLSKIVGSLILLAGCVFASLPTPVEAVNKCWYCMAGISSFCFLAGSADGVTWRTIPQTRFDTARDVAATQCREIVGGCLNFTPRTINTGSTGCTVNRPFEYRGYSRVDAITLPPEGTSIPNSCWLCQDPVDGGRRLCFVSNTITNAHVVLNQNPPQRLTSCVTQPMTGCNGMETQKLYGLASSGAGGVDREHCNSAFRLEPPEKRLIFNSVPPPAATDSANDPPPRPFRSINPNPAFPIPGVEFTPAVQNGSNVVIPFLAQYIGGIFRFLIGLGTIAASAMVVYGGFRYLMAASLPDVKDGKETIKDAILGLVVLLGSYVILQTINPELLNLKPLSLTFAQNEILSTEQNLNTTTLPTSGNEFEPSGHHSSGSSGSSGSGSSWLTGECPIQGLPPGHLDCGREGKPPCTPEHCTALGRPAGCSDNAPPLSREPRYQAFRSRIGSILRSNNPQERAIQVATAAAQCQVHMGSCGGTAEIIRELAASPVSAHHTFESSALVRQVRQIRCERPARCPAAPADCSHDGEAAKQRVRDIVRADQDARANMLKPGDWFWIYNANTSDCGGQHSVVFVSWDGAYARVVQGEWGKNVRAGRVCLKTNCPNGKFAPITRIQ